jgi:hypothetical protein
VEEAVRAASSSSSEAPSSSSSRLRNLQGVAHVKLGVNFVQTEENQTGEAHLVHAMGWLVQHFGVPREAVDFPTVGRAEPEGLSGLGGASPPSPSTATPLPFADAVALACAALEAVNYLALLYSGWGNHSRALRCLRVGKRIHARVRTLQAAEPEAAAAEEEGTAAPSSAAASPLAAAHGAGLASLDSLYTHLLFYYAQVYGHLHVPEASARYVERTLSRQLAEQVAADEDHAAAAAARAAASASQSEGPDWHSGSSAASLDKVEWTRNVLRLAEYHVGKRAWRAAAICCWAAEGMLGKLIAAEEEKKRATAGDRGAAGSAAALVAGGDPSSSTPLPEAVSRLLAESATHWGLLYEAMLRIARERDMRRAMRAEMRARTGVKPRGDKEAEADDEDEDDEGDDGRDGSADDGDDDGGDPFSTGAMVSFGRMRRGEASSKLRGEGDDVVDVTDSDHDGEMELLGGARSAALRRRRQGGSAAADPASAELSSSSSSTSHPLGPLAAFVASCRAQHKEHIVSYGPAKLAGDTLSCPGGTFASGLQALPDPSSVTTFAQARDLFKASLSAFSRAKEHFVLDGFVSEHVGIATGISKIYKYLAFYETDGKRRAAMHLRRCAALVPILAELNPSVFLRFHRELSLEAASSYQEAFDARLAVLEGRVDAQAVPQAPSKAEFAGLTEAADGALTSYAHFVRCFVDPRLPSPVPVDARNAPLAPVAGATVVEDEAADAYMTAHFCVARMLSRRIGGSPAERLADTKSALARFEWILRAAPAVAPRSSQGGAGGGGGFFAQELDMCREMVDLLPKKVAHLHYRGVDVGAPRGV